MARHFKFKVMKYVRSVNKITNTGIFVCKYNSIKDAAKDCNISASSIINCIRGREKTAGGYIWEYNNEKSKLRYIDESLYIILDE